MLTEVSHCECHSMLLRLTVLRVSLAFDVAALRLAWLPPARERVRLSTESSRTLVSTRNLSHAQSSAHPIRGQSAHGIGLDTSLVE